MTRIALTVNGSRHEADVEPRQLLVYFLREQLGLNGTNVGCDTTSCGACTVLLDGESVKSCTVLAVQADGCEGDDRSRAWAHDERVHTVQQAFHEQHALQCGYCTPGYGDRNDLAPEGAPGPVEDDEVRQGLKGNLCRCTGYHNIVERCSAGTRAGA